MNPGDLRDRIIIQALSEVSDGAGGRTGTWLDWDSVGNAGEVWAKVVPMKGKRMKEFGQTFDGRPWEVVVRYATLYAVGNIQLYRIIHKSRVLYLQMILNQDDRNDFITILAEEKGGETASSVNFVKQLDIIFGAAGDDDRSITVAANAVGTYTSNTLTNVATVVYKVNTVTKTLPITLALADTFLITITRTTAAVESEIVLNGTG